MSTTDPGQERTLGQLVAQATQDISTLVRGEIALAKLEISAQVKKAGLGGALLAAAGVVAFYSVYFIFTTIAEALEALGLARWLSYLIVTVFMLLIAGVLALLGIRKMKTVEPKPERTIVNAQETVAGVKTAAKTPHVPAVIGNGAVPSSAPTEGIPTPNIEPVIPAGSHAELSETSEPTHTDRG